MKSTMQVHFGLDSVHLVYLVCLVEPNKAGQVYKRNQPALAYHAPQSVGLVEFSVFC
jgi:hypothetical protein